MIVPRGYSRLCSGDMSEGGTGQCTSQLTHTPLSLLQHLIPRAAAVVCCHFLPRRTSLLVFLFSWGAESAAVRAPAFHGDELLVQKSSSIDLCAGNITENKPANTKGRSQQKGKGRFIRTADISGCGVRSTTPQSEHPF